MSMPERHPSAEVPSQLAFIFQHLPTGIRRPVYGAIDHLLPEDRRTSLEMAMRSTYDMLLWQILLEAQERKIPTKMELEAVSIETLKFQSRTHLAGHKRLLFPDLPQIPEILSGTSGQFDRLAAARLFPHPSFGIRPDTTIYTPTGRYVEHISHGLDQELLEQMYFSHGMGREIYRRHLNLVRDEIMYGKIPSTDQKTVDRLRFLGLPDEKSFIYEIENQLIDRLRQKGADSTQIDKLTHFMKFAKNSDIIRATLDPIKQGKRNTNESYYCHCLASTWLLWTMIEPDINTPDELNEALEDLEVTFIHDIPEDLPTNFHPEDPSYIPSDLQLTIDGLNDYLHLNIDQWRILKALTKTPQEDGALWLERIKQFGENRLVRRAARCKAADRFSNFLTMTVSGGKFHDVLRKLEETRYASGQLLWLANFGDLKPMATYERLVKLSNEERLVSMLTAIPVLAEIEKRILLNQFGRIFFEKIMSSDEAWAKNMQKVIKASINLPPYQTRLDELFAIYRTPQLIRDRVIPAWELSSYLGLTDFTSDEQWGTSEKPLEFKDFLPLIIRSHNFIRWIGFTPWRGVLPGGVDDVYGPGAIWYFQTPNFFHEMNEVMMKTVITKVD